MAATAPPPTAAGATDPAARREDAAEVVRMVLGAGVVAALRAHLGAAEVQANGCYVFYHLADHQKAAVVVAWGAPALVASAARRFESNAQIQNFAEEKSQRMHLTMTP